MDTNFSTVCRFVGLEQVWTIRLYYTVLFVIPTTVHTENTVPVLYFTVKFIVYAVCTYVGELMQS